MGPGNLVQNTMIRSGMGRGREGGGGREGGRGLTSDTSAGMHSATRGVASPASYKRGGVVRRGGLARVHAGEKVIPRAKRRTKRRSGRKGGRE